MESNDDNTVPPIFHTPSVLQYGSDWEHVVSAASNEQQTVEYDVGMLLYDISSSSPVTVPAHLRNNEYYTYDGLPLLVRDKHIQYLLSGLHGNLSSSWTSLDASRTWLIYWCLHSLELLDALEHPEVQAILPSIITFLSQCQHKDGGYGGGIGQVAHSASTYAAILSLLIIGTPEAYQSINRPLLYSYYRQLFHTHTDPITKETYSYFRVQRVDGEMDVRATYTVIAIADLLNLLTPVLTNNVDKFLLRCQTYEGGYGGEPNNEAHGGYTYCAVAALAVLNQLQASNMDSLQRWLCNRQMILEGGFQGRTSKLVDGCYSFWQGACFTLIHKYYYGKGENGTIDGTINITDAAENQGKEQQVTNLSVTNTVVTKNNSLNDDKSEPSIMSTANRTTVVPLQEKLDDPDDTLLCNRLRLQQYLLQACQDYRGGLRDKPGKSRDYYHTCYCLSGLSIMQHNHEGSASKPGWVLGPYDNNLLKGTHPIYNITLEKVENAKKYFSSLPIPSV